MPTLTIQKSNNACQIRSAEPTTNFIDNTQLPLGSGNNGIGVFDFSALPSRAIITTVRLILYISPGTPDTGTYTLTVNRVLRDDLNINQVTWNSYKTGRSWQTAGASGANDITSTYSATQSFSPTASSVSVDVTDMAKYARDNKSQILRVLMTVPDKLTDYCYFHSSAYGGDKPKLAVTYKLPSLICMM